MLSEQNSLPTFIGSREQTTGAYAPEARKECQMHRNILAICAALVAFAVAPAMASASPVLQESGVNVATGTKIVATNEGNTIFSTNLGNVTCTGSTLTGTLTTNSGKLIEGDLESASYTGSGAGGDCTTAFAGDVKVTVTSLPWCIKTTSTTADTWEIRGGNCNEAARSLTFVLDFTSSGAECKYQRSAVTGTYTTGGAQAVLTTGASQTFSGETGNSFICPSSGNVEMSYKLETENGTALQIN